MRGYARVCKVCKGVEDRHGYARICKGMQGYARVCDLQRAGVDVDLDAQRGGARDPGHDVVVVLAAADVRLGGETSMQWVATVTYCFGNEAAGGQEEEALVNREYESQQRRRLKQARAQVKAKADLKAEALLDKQTAQMEREYDDAILRLTRLKNQAAARARKETSGGSDQ